MLRKTLTFILALSVLILYGQKNALSDKIILKVKDGYAAQIQKDNEHNIIGIESVDQLSLKNGIVNVRELQFGKKNAKLYYLLQFPADADILSIVSEYNLLSEVDYAEPDYIVSIRGPLGVTPNDALYARQWGLKNDGTFPLGNVVAGIDINAENAWTITQGSTNVVEAIIDTGGKLDHPEFAGRLWTNSGETGGNNSDDDGNGFVDDVHGWDFINNDNDATDDHGHGTNVAGIVGATGNNSIGYAGVDWNCKLMILKALDDQGFGSWSAIAGAVYYAVDNGAHVINMSLGGPSSITMQSAINYGISNNVCIVVSMGNDNSETPSYPAAYPGVIAVGSIDGDGNRTHPFFWNPNSGSNFGSHISVGAPGNYIYGLDNNSNTNYNYYWGGTSQAAPHVAGVVGLMLAKDPTLTPGQIKVILESTARDQIGDPSEDVPGWDKYYGYGLIDAFEALSAIGNNIDCNNLSGFGSAAAPTTPTPVTITTCMYAGEYNTVTGCVAGRDYTFTATGGSGNYITIRQGTVNGTVLGAGTSPLTVTCTANGNLYVHVNTNASCGTDASCHTTTVACSSCTGPADPCSSITPLTCGTATTVTLSGAGAWASNPCWSSPGQEKIYSFTPTASGTATLVVTATNSGAWVDYNFKAASGGCSNSGWTCISDIFSPGSYNFTVTAGVGQSTLKVCVTELLADSASSSK